MFFVFSPVFGLSEIFEVKTFREVMRNLPKDDDFIMFSDIDGVLLTETDVLLVSESIKPGTLHTFAAKYNCELSDDALSVITLNSEKRLMDEDVFTLFDQLKERDIPCFALTSCRTGQSGRITSLEEWCYHVLASHNLMFSDLPNKPEQIFPPEPISSQNSTFFKGIICSSVYDKGMILSLFLKKYHKFMRRTVLFMDDKINNVNAVKSYVEKLGLDFIGFHFQRDQHCTVDEKVAEIQLRHLHLHKNWLSDESCRLILHNKSLKSVSF